MSHAARLERFGRITQSTGDTKEALTIRGAGGNVCTYSRLQSSQGKIVDTRDRYGRQPSLREHLLERGRGPSMILREHLEVLKQYADEMYAGNAQVTLDGLESDDLDEIPLDVQEDDTHVCVNYFLPNGKMIRVLPNIGFEVRRWEEVSDGRGAMVRRQEMTWKLVVYRVTPDV